MRLTVVGCSGSYPGPESAASCYLLEAEEAAAPGGSCSTSATARSASCTATPTRSTIDAVFLSHLHADHCLDLCGYYVMRKYHPTGAQPRIPVWGPAGTAERMARAYDLPLDPGMTEEFAFHATRATAAVVELGPVPRRGTPAWSTRSPPSPSGHRRWSRTLVYSGDTGPCPELDEAAVGADLLLAEASFRRRRRQPARPAHDRRRLRTYGAARRRRAPRADPHPAVARRRPVAEAEARAEWSGPVELARAGETYEI